MRIKEYLYKDYFVKIYDNLNEEINGYRLKQSDKLLFGFIYHGCYLNKCSGSWNGAECNWGNQTLANNSGLTERQVRKSIKNLEKAGLIIKKKRKNGKILEVVGEPYADDTFIKMYTQVSRNKDFTINDRFIYTVIHHLCENKKYSGCLANNKRIADRVNCTSNTVGNSIRKLKELGYINVKHINKNTREIKIINDLWVIQR